MLSKVIMLALHWAENTSVMDVTGAEELDWEMDETTEPGTITLPGGKVGKQRGAGTWSYIRTS